MYSLYHKLLGNDNEKNQTSEILIKYFPFIIGCYCCILNVHTDLDCANFISEMKTKNNVKWLIFIVILSKSNPLEEKSNRVSLLYL